MTIELNTPAPYFSEVSDSSSTIRLDDFKGKKLILYFYPKDDTPGCTLEACGFRDLSDTLKALGTEIVGVSRDSVRSHQNFKAKHQLTFPLLADETGVISKAYEVILDSKIERSTFLIDQEGIIRHIWRGVKVPGHVDEVIEAVKKMP